MLAMSCALCLLASGCHSSRKDVPKVSPVEYDRPANNKTAKNKKGVEPKTGQRLVNEARKWLGTRYRYGGESRSGTDCSGFTMKVYEKVTGIKLPRDSRSQQSFTSRVKQRDLSAGDLVFFATKSGGSRVGHVGIYISGGEFIHASTSKGVIISSLSERYYANHYHSAGRVPGIKEGKLRTPEVSPPLPERKDIPVITKPADAIEISLDSLIEISAPQDRHAKDSISTIVKNAF